MLVYSYAIIESGGNKMPTISMFFGILIRMYYDEHNPPHFHASYQGIQATFDMDGNILEAISLIDRRN